VKELKEGLEEILRRKLPEKRVQKVMDDFDASGDGVLQPNEFVTLDQLRNKIDAVAREEEKEPQQAPGFLQTMFSNVFDDTCESNFDCKRPEVCCDFVFKKMCCSSGEMGRNLQQEYALVPVPVTI